MMDTPVLCYLLASPVSFVSLHVLTSLRWRAPAVLWLWEGACVCVARWETGLVTKESGSVGRFSEIRGMPKGREKRF